MIRHIEIVVSTDRLVVDLFVHQSGGMFAFKDFFGGKGGQWWTIVDFCIIVLNNVIVLGAFLGMERQKLRIYEVFLILLMCLKSLYYLKLVGPIAPLIDIIQRILVDIKDFIVIFLIGWIAFSYSFFIIGQN